MLSLADIALKLERELREAQDKPRIPCTRCKEHKALDLPWPTEQLCDDCETALRDEENRKQKIEQFHEHRRISGLPETLHTASLKHYDLDYGNPAPEIRAQRKTILNYAARFGNPEQNPPAKGLFIAGPAGTGKTHILAALCNRACLTHQPVWLDGHDLRNRITAEWTRDPRNTMFAQRLALEIAHHDSIFLDDVTVEANPPEWFKAALNDILNAIITRRHKLLFITSNLRIEEQQNTDRTGQTIRGQERDIYLKKVFGERFTSRLRGLCQPFFLDGPDLRAL